MASWLEVNPLPARMRRHRYLLLREPYMALRGDPCEALLLHWAELGTRFRLANLAEREGGPAVERVLARIRAGERLEEFGLACSLPKLASRELFGAFGVAKVRRSLGSLIADGLLAAREPPPGSHDPTTYWYLAGAIECALAEHGYAETQPLSLVDQDGGTDDRGSKSNPRGSGSHGGGSQSHPGGSGSHGRDAGSNRAGARSTPREVPGEAARDVIPLAAPLASAAPIDREQPQDLIDEGEEPHPSPPVGDLHRRPLVTIGVPESLAESALEALDVPAEVRAALERWAEGGQQAILLLGGGRRSQRALAAAAALGAQFDAGRCGGEPWWLDLPRDREGLVDFRHPDREEFLRRRSEPAGSLVVSGLERVRDYQLADAVEAIVQSRLQAKAAVLACADRGMAELHELAGRFEALQGVLEIITDAGFAEVRL